MRTIGELKTEFRHELWEESSCPHPHIRGTFSAEGHPLTHSALSESFQAPPSGLLSNLSSRVVHLGPPRGFKLGFELATLAFP